jgi:hypothetical protein
MLFCLNQNTNVQVEKNEESSLESLELLSTEV